jgi:hypothetical protein
MELLKQRFNYATIDLIRDDSLFDIEKYSGLDVIEPIEVKDISDDLTSEFDDIFSVKTDSLSITPVFKNDRFQRIKLEPLPEKGRKTKHFYNNVDKKEYVHFQKLTKNPLYTTKEKYIKRHFMNPFASIEIFTHERTITLENNKLYIRSYKHRRWRDFNWKYFRKSNKIETLSINLEKGDFTIGDMSNASSRKTKRFRKNSFGTLEALLASNQFLNKRGSVPKNTLIHEKFVETFNDTEMLEIISQYIPNMPKKYDDKTDKDEFIKSLIEFFVTKKRIKTSNEYISLIRRYYPTEKFLKKNDRKLVQSILDSYGINSKFTNKLLHEHPNINLQDFSFFCSLFGKDFTKYVGSLSPDAFKFFNNKDEPYNGSTPLDLRGVKNNRIVTSQTTEKENIIKIVNNLVEEMKEKTAPVGNIYSLFKDHFDMIDKVREYDPNFKMTATTYADFHIEHMELSKMISLIKKGWTIEYQFDNRMVRLVEEEIVFLHNDLKTYIFKPQILKREEEYTEEGAFMHHCVATYSKKESSIIISLRTDGGMDRVTCEFVKKTGDCVQERHFCNKVPPEYFQEPLRVLKERVKRFANQRLLDHIDIKKVKVMINGKEVDKKETRNDFEIFLDNVLDGGALEF